jgi:predicted HNH restriction endonuclease
VHHLIPLSSLGGVRVTYLRDLVVLCPNCHRAIHANGKNRSLEELAAFLTEQRK